MVKVAVVANGIGEFDPQGFDKIIAVDGGLQQVEKPDLLVGDFDSVDEELLAKYPASMIRRFPKDKDESDTELAIALAYGELKADEVTLFAFFGERVDHSLYNIYLLKKFPDLMLQNDKETLFLLKGRMVMEMAVGTIISLIPLSDQVMGVMTEGLKWKLKGEALTKTFMSLSNEVIKTPVSISAYSGDLLICVTRPQPK